MKGTHYGVGIPDYADDEIRKQREEDARMANEQKPVYQVWIENATGRTLVGERDTRNEARDLAHSTLNLVDVSDGMKVCFHLKQ